MSGTSGLVDWGVHHVSLFTQYSVLLRLKERRAAFLKSCIPLLTHIFDRVAQPDDSEESEDEEEGL